MASDWGRRLRLSLFGESHGPGVGVVLDAPPPGQQIDLEALAAFMARRAPSGGSYSTRRKETDRVEVLSGLYNGMTTGTPLAMLIKNADTHSADYENLKNHPRPSHADYTGSVRYGGYNDHRGGGHFSGRLTAPLVAAGGIAKQILAGRGVQVGAHLLAVGGEQDRYYQSVALTPEELLLPGSRTFPVLCEEAGARMLAAIEAVRMQGDSLGGVIECGIVGLAAGLGDPMFWGVENAISSLVFGIPAVRGIEFGAGFSAAAMQGSQHNDCWCKQGESVATVTNHHGGIVGGITSGMPVVFRVAMKPTPSISRPQETLSLESGQIQRLVVEGRHDPCLAVRAVPCVEAAAALAALEYYV